MGFEHLILAAAFFMLVQGPVHASDREAYAKDKLPLLQNVITLEAVARYNLGFEGGRRHYRYIDREAKNGMHYFYSVVSYDHELINGVPAGIGRFSSPSANFAYTTPASAAQTAEEYDKEQVYVVPNPATTGGNGTVQWNLVSRNGQNITSGEYLFSVEPEDGRFDRAIGKFVIIR